MVNGWIKIEKEFFERNDLSANEKLIYIYISGYQDFFVSSSKMARKFRLNKKTILTCLHNLEAKGLIWRNGKQGRSIIYRSKMSTEYKQGSVPKTDRDGPKGGRESVQNEYPNKKDLNKNKLISDFSNFNGNREPTINDKSKVKEFEKLVKNMKIKTV